MESLPRSPHSSRNHSTATRASSSSSSLTLKSPYRDVLFSDGGKVEFGAHKLAEIFPCSPSSIPVLDLSGLHEGVGSGDSRNPKLDYPTIFSGLRDGDVTVPSDEVLGCAQKKTETRNPAYAPSHDRESISRKTKMPSGDPPDTFPTDETNQHFSMSFGKSSLSTIGDPPNGEVHVNQLRGVPFTYFADNNNPQKSKNEDAPNHSSLPKGEVSRKWSFSTVEEVTTAKDGSSIPKKATLPPLFDEESDENSLAALSAAALKKAVEQAEESIRIAKTIMEREKDRFLEGSLGSRSKGLLSKKIRLENGPEKVRENVPGVKDGLGKRGESRNVGRKVKANDSGSRVEEYAVEQEEIGESDEKKRHFGHDGETLCEEFRHHVQVEENNFSEARKSETSRHSEEIDSMTVSSGSREQSDVDSNNGAEEYQEDDQKNEKERSLESKEEPLSVHGVREIEENENEAISGKEELKNVTGESETDRKSSNEISKESKDSKANERKFEKDYQQQRIEAIKRGREREKDRIVVERAIREARERAFAEARERAERERAARERGANADKAAAAEARIRAARAMVERATAEARERALEKARSEKTSSSSRNGLRHSFSSSDLERVDGKGGESAQRRNARLERHHRTMERAAKALAEKNMRDFLAQKEQADRNRLAESLDADIKRWVRGKEGNLRALLSTLQYILGPDSGWQPVSLTEIISAAAVKKAYRKATLCVHPDKLQQRGANIQQKYICEKVFDLLKAAWNRFDTEER